MAYNTNNPLGSSDPRDLFDNSANFDEGMGSTAESFLDRFGRPRATWQKFHNLTINAESQIGETVTTAKARVNAAADAGIEDIDESVAAVDAAEAAAISQMQETAANLGDDLNNKRYDTYAEMLADPQTRDAVMAVVDGDEDPNLNGWYSWSATSGAWIRFVNQPAIKSLVDDQFYREADKLSGDGDLVMDAQSGQMLVSLPLKRADAAVFIAGDKEPFRVDTEQDHLVVNSALRRSVDIMDGSEGHSDRREYPEIYTLPVSDSALVFGLQDGSIALQIDTKSRKVKTDFSFDWNIEQRPPSVYVDAPPRLERNINDPDYRLSGRLYQATATIERTGSERYWLAWRADNQLAGEGPGNFAVLAYSDDGGQTVEEYGYFTFTAADDPLNPLPIAQRAGRDKHIVDPMLWKDPDGRLWLLFGVFGNNKLMDGVGGCWAVICHNPNAEFPVWGVPFRLSYFGDPRHPVQVNGDWYLAVDGWRSNALYPPREMEYVGPHIYKFDWRNKKLEHISQLPPNNGSQHSGFFETEFVQRADGSVLATCRWNPGDSGVLMSVSTDMMKTWTPWVNYLALAPSSSSRIWLGRSPSGRLLICWNHDIDRKTLTLALSDDEGATWPHQVVLEPNSVGQVTYPIVTFGDGGLILVAYDNERTAKRQIHVAKVIEQEVVAGTSVPVIKTVSDPFNP